MRGNILQMMKTKKLMMKLAMVTLVGTVGSLGVSGTVSAMKSNVKSVQVSGTTSEETSAKKSPDATESDGVGCKDSSMSSESKLSQTRSSEGKIHNAFIQIDFEEGALPKVKKLKDLKNQIFEEVQPRIYLTDCYLQDLVWEDKSLETYKAEINGLFSELSGCKDQKELRSILDNHSSKFGFEQLYDCLCFCFDPMNDSSFKKDVAFGMKISSLTNAFVEATKLVLNNKVKGNEQSIVMMCKRLRSFADEYPDIIERSNIERAINKIIEIKKLKKPNVFNADYKLHGVKARSDSGIGKFLSELSKVNEAQMAVYNKMLEAQSLSDVREYKAAEKKSIEAQQAMMAYKNGFGDFYSRYILSKEIMPIEQIEKNFNENCEKIQKFWLGLLLSNELDDCIREVSGAYYTKVKDAFDREIAWYRKRLEEKSELIRKIFTNEGFEFEAAVKCVVSLSWDEERDSHDRQMSEALEIIDKLLQSLDDFYAIGTTYLTEKTVQEVKDSIENLEKLRLEVEKNKDEEQDIDKFLGEIIEQIKQERKERERMDQELQELEHKNEEEALKREQMEQQRRKIEEERIAKIQEREAMKEAHDRQEENKRAETERKAKEYLERQSQNREQRRKEVVRCALETSNPIYKVTYVNDVQRRSAEKFLLEHSQYEEDWQQWYDSACRGWFTTNHLKNIPDKPFFTAQKGLVKAAYGLFYEAKLRTDGEQQGLRVVFYKDKDSAMVVVIYAGKPFGKQHNNEMPPIPISEVTFDLAAREYGEMGKKMEKSAATSATMTEDRKDMDSKSEGSVQKKDKSKVKSNHKKQSKKR